MAAPRITVGLPVFNGADLVGKALDGLKRQTFSDFEVIISVDGGDQETAAACEPFLADSRFRMIVQRKRLDWVGNFNWLLQQKHGEFFAIGSTTTTARLSSSRFCSRARFRTRTRSRFIATANSAAESTISKSPRRSKANPSTGPLPTSAR